MEDKEYQRAKARVRKVRGFYNNLVTYVLVNILLILINLITSPKELWFYWVTVIWGAILIIQAFNTFTLRNTFLSEEWEERKIKELLEKERLKKNSK